MLMMISDMTGKMTMSVFDNVSHNNNIIDKQSYALNFIVIILITINFVKF